MSGAWIGVITGLLAAFFSALSYLVSRHHVLSHPELEGEGGGPRLIVQSHVLMGLACIPACLLLWPRGGGPVVAALALQRGDDRLPARALGLILVACLCFAIADLAIVSLIGRLAGGGAEPMGRFHAGILAMAITYAACGAILLPAAPRMWPRSGGGWLPAVQYSLVWLLAMIALYACLGQVGAVFGNILQSTRGVMSVVLGAGLAQAGWPDLEEQVDRATLLKRIAAAMLMTAAIALYFSDVS